MLELTTVKNILSLGVSTEQLIPITWRAIRMLQLAMVRHSVISIVADGAICNCRFFQLHKILNIRNLVYKLYGSQNYITRQIATYSSCQILCLIMSSQSNMHSNGSKNQLHIHKLQMFSEDYFLRIFCITAAFSHSLINVPTTVILVTNAFYILTNNIMIFLTTKLCICLTCLGIIPSIPNCL